MNFLTETADGPRCLSPREARMRIDQLREQMDAADPFTRRRLEREIDALRPAANPELMYGEWLI